MGTALQVIAIVGRPNVGKSTLFNSLIRQRKAIVGDRPGVTVDRLESEWRLGERKVTLVDTGGIGHEDPGGASEQRDMQFCIEQQVEAALDVADLVMFVVDGEAGLTPVDQSVADKLRRRNMNVVLVVNKAENPDMAAEFFSLGMGDPVAVSALHEHGIRQLRDMLDQRLPRKQSPEQHVSDIPASHIVARLAVIGRPNVGKSTLINAWLGRERMVVSSKAGTTRDAVDVDMPYVDKENEGVVRLVDTAGQRRHARISDVIEFVARVKAQQAFARADAAMLLLDGSEDVAEQDMRLMGLAQEKGCALLVAVNKVDLLDAEAWKYYAERLDFRMRSLADIPVFRIAAKQSKGVKGLLKHAVQAARRNRVTLNTGELNRWLTIAQEKQQPPSDDGAAVRMKYCTQVSTAPPVIKIFCNRPKAMKQTYRRYLERDFRKRFNLPGVPVRLEFSTTDNPYGGRGKR
ncbi:MAG: ribosome biogenesis GTPase Der [Mariprofundaceae bacterium]|nr:ribosome biogenesis GTPase Der [Mariprofundaceae bacterium]